MSFRKAKSAPKMYTSDRQELQGIVLRTLEKAAGIVASTLGPGGRNCLLESDFPGLPNRNSKDGVTVLRSLGAINAYEHMILEQVRDAATRTGLGAGDGTTTATLLSFGIVKHLFDFCDRNPKYSPQKAARRIIKVTNDLLVPFVQSRSIVIDESNKNTLEMVARISANGDADMAAAVIKAFEEIGYGDASHVTLRELSGPKGYKVERIDGFPIPMGYEESTGKFHTAFINDAGNARCYMEKPLFLLFDGNVNDIVSVIPLLNDLGHKYVHEGNSDFKNLVIFANGFSDNVLTQLAFNFQDPNTINVIPMVVPMSQFANSQQHFLQDLAAFTGATLFGLGRQLNKIAITDLGKGMENFECYRFRSTVVGDPDSVNIEVRSGILKKLMENAGSEADRIALQERIGKITNGIAKLTIYGGSQADLKESHDRCEDAVCAVRSAISHGALPGGCRLAIDMSLKLAQELDEGDPAREVLMGALMMLPQKLLDNAGCNEEEIQGILSRLIESPDEVYDVENQIFGKAEELGLFDATKAVTESLSNAVSIATVLGTMGGLVCHPRDDVFERSEARADSEFTRAVENPHQYRNEANERP
jgi:chaperonin GroEL